MHFYTSATAQRLCDGSSSFSLEGSFMLGME